MKLSKKHWLLILACVVLVSYGLFTPKQPAPVAEAKTKTYQPPAMEERLATPPPKKGSSTRALNQNKADFFTSPAGIKYGQDYSGKFESRIAHVMAHTRPDPNKYKHSIYLETSREGVISLLDEAWKKRGPPQRQGGNRGRDVYDISMRRIIGTEGERRIRIVTEANSAEIITAYPMN